MKTLKQIGLFILIAALFFSYGGAVAGVISMLSTAGWRLLGVCVAVACGFALVPEAKALRKLVGLLQGGHHEED